MKLTRRRFLWTAAGVGGASLVVGWTVFGDDPPLASSTPGGFMPNAFLELAPDNVIRFHCPRDEMGQGVTTGLATLIGEELDVAPAALRVEFAAVHPAYRNPVFRLAHAPMEPMNAVVRIEPDRVDVWSGTQSPAGARGLVARTLDIPVERVHMHSTWLGGGFGRRGALGHVVEAAEAAAASGKPVQVVWTREDDIRRGLYRPASLMRIRAGVAADGTLTAWEATRVGANITPDMVGVALPGVLPGLPDSLVEAAVGTVDKVTRDWIVAGSSVEGLHGDYDVANRSVRHVTRDHGLPVLFWRSVGHSYTAFAKESAIDALAHASRLDPVELRLRNTRDNPRLAEVVRIAGERMKAMRKAMPGTPGRGLGLAAHGSYESYVAQVAEVSVDGGAIRVHKVLCVIDCGLAVNPDVVRAQMEGSVVYGLSATLHGNLEVENGAIRESNFHDYPIVRMHEAPDVEVIIVDSDEPPTGVGEPGVPPVAPAVANAVFAATGRRLTSLPLKLV